MTLTDQVNGLPAAPLAAQSRPHSAARDRCKGPRSRSPDRHTAWEPQHPTTPRSRLSARDGHRSGSALVLPTVRANRLSYRGRKAARRRASRRRTTTALITSSLSNRCLVRRHVAHIEIGFDDALGQASSEPVGARDTAWVQTWHRWVPHRLGSKGAKATLRSSSRGGNRYAWPCLRSRRKPRLRRECRRASGAGGTS
jgi:hypothetical protein